MSRNTQFPLPISLLIPATAAKYFAQSPLLHLYLSLTLRNLNVELITNVRQHQTCCTPKKHTNVKKKIRHHETSVEQQNIRITCCCIHGLNTCHDGHLKNANGVMLGAESDNARKMQLCLRNSHMLNLNTHVADRLVSEFD